MPNLRESYMPVFTRAGESEVLHHTAVVVDDAAVVVMHDAADRGRHFSPFSMLWIT